MSDEQLRALLKRIGSDLPAPVVNIGCGMHAFGDIRLDFSVGAAQILADCDRGIPLADHVAGTVFSRFLLEHLRDVGVLLQDAARVIRPGGQIVVITDNAAYPTFHLGIQRPVGQVHRPGGYVGRSEADQHYSLFTDAHLMNHLAHAGFEQVVVAYADAVEVGYLEKRPLLQRAQRILGAMSGSLAQYSRPYLLPHIVGIGYKPQR
jgi:ubiquinone/menaquinone biosynthesis C-methylase UbiE